MPLARAHAKNYRSGISRKATGEFTDYMQVTQGVQGGGGQQRATVGPDRRIHILDGDTNGGGHRPGTGIKGKSEFPAGWSDDKIVREIESVANDPFSARTVQKNGRVRVEGARDGVDITVIVDGDGKTIRTAHPTNLPRNP